MTIPDTPLPVSESPAALVAIIRAARLTGDADLEAAARRELRDRFGMLVAFAQKGVDR